MSDKPTRIPVSHAEFARSASYLASSATKWVGDISGNVVMGLDSSTKPLKEEALDRFRKEILTQLNFATGYERDYQNE